MDRPFKPGAKMPATLAELTGHGKAAMARALSAIEARGLDAETCALLDAAYAAPRAHVIGLTGPPGAGKSTLIDAMLRHWRRDGLRVGVIAVDPSSQRSRGALLGDRIRMRTDPDDDGVFVRSFAARDRLGGLSEHAFAAMVLMRAAYDRVIVETVGVGQSEADIATIADTVVLCIQPGSGDALQFMKAGIMEIPHVAVVTKADTGEAADRALNDLRGALSLGAELQSWTPQCVKVSAAHGTAIADVLTLCEAHRAAFTETELRQTRADQAAAWLREAVKTRFGNAGLEAAGDAAGMACSATPFSQTCNLLARLSVTCKSPI